MITLAFGGAIFNNIKAIIFDKDGTLIDSGPYWGRVIELRAKALTEYYQINKLSLADICEALGLSVKENRLKEEGPIALVSREEVIDIIWKLLNSIHINTTKFEISDIFTKTHDVFKKEMDKYIKIIPGVKEFLDKIPSDIVKILITSDALANTVKGLELVGVKKYFDMILTKENSDKPKSSGELAKAALRKFNVDISEAVVIGDSPADYQMGKNAGTDKIILVASGQISKEKLSIYSEYTVSSLDDIKISNCK